MACLLQRKLWDTRIACSYLSAVIFFQARKLRNLLSRKNKTKNNWCQTIKTITNEFECFDVRPLYCNFASFYNKKQQELYCAFSTNIMLKNIYNNKFSHALLFWYKYMYRNYCFRRISNTLRGVRRCS